MNEHFKKQLERYINGDIDSIYDHMTSNNSSNQPNNQSSNHSSNHSSNQPNNQSIDHNSNSNSVNNTIGTKTIHTSNNTKKKHRRHREEPETISYQVDTHQSEYGNNLHPVYNPYHEEDVIHDYEKQIQERNYEEQSLREKYAVDYLDKSNFEAIKQNGIEMAKNILITQSKIDYYKAIKKKTSLKLEDYNKRKDNECEPLIEFLLHTNIDYIEHDGHKLSLVNGKNKKYIKISKIK
jgi:hypothetical protein